MKSENETQAASITALKQQIKTIDEWKNLTGELRDRVSELQAEGEELIEMNTNLNQQLQLNLEGFEEKESVIAEKNASIEKYKQVIKRLNMDVQ